MQDFVPFTLQLLGALTVHRPKFVSLASLAVLHLLFQNSLLLLKVFKALMVTIKFDRDKLYWSQSESHWLLGSKK